MVASLEWQCGLTRFFQTQQLTEQPKTDETFQMQHLTAESKTDKMRVGAHAANRAEEACGNYPDSAEQIDN
jgi:hypothetical protein